MENQLFKNIYLRCHDLNSFFPISSTIFHTTLAGLKHYLCTPYPHFTTLTNVTAIQFSNLRWDFHRRIRIAQSPPGRIMLESSANYTSAFLFWLIAGISFQFNFSLVSCIWNHQLIMTSSTLHKCLLLKTENNIRFSTWKQFSKQNFLGFSHSKFHQCYGQ